MPLFDELWKLLKELFAGLPRLVHIFLWSLLAIVVLPCVFITHFLYPIWEKWGKDF